MKHTRFLEKRKGKLAGAASTLSAGTRDRYASLGIASANELTPLYPMTARLMTTYFVADVGDPWSLWRGCYNELSLLPNLRDYLRPDYWFGDSIDCAWLYYGRQAFTDCNLLPNTKAAILEDLLENPCL